MEGLAILIHSIHFYTRLENVFSMEVLAILMQVIDDIDHRNYVVMTKIWVLL